mmetsp:Transcript_60877/g.69607  ORF Transcript_60877/g.69607 Transcript_60877/m.69607 type:complete len:142 (+) Transcript_60877:99-524(+)
MADSDNEQVDTKVEETGELNLESALRAVLLKARVRGEISRGLNEVCLALDKKAAKICLLSDSCDNDSYKKLIAALCNEQDVPLIRVPDGQFLGRLAGLCKIDASGEPRSIVRTSSVTINNFGEESDAKTWLEDYAAKNASK